MKGIMECPCSGSETTFPKSKKNLWKVPALAMRLLFPHPKKGILESSCLAVRLLFKRNIESLCSGSETTFPTSKKRNYGKFLLRQ
jgi:hypothetical protein